MLFAQAEVIGILFALGIGLVVVIAQFILFVKIGAPWFQAFMAGVPISVSEILGMQFRRVDVKAVVNTLIMASQAGAPLSSAEVERAYLQGVDLEKITLAYIKAKKDNMDLTFQDLVDADMDDQLAEKLGR